jgi:hypothetical protein
MSIRFVRSESTSEGWNAGSAISNTISVTQSLTRSRLIVMLYSSVTCKLQATLTRGEVDG